jgi:hypothetical protein
MYYPDLGSDFSHDLHSKYLLGLAHRLVMEQGTLLLCLCCGDLKLRYGTLRQISREQRLLSQHRPSGLMSKE